MSPLSVIAHLTAGDTSLLVASDGGTPAVVHWGSALGDDRPEPALFDRAVPPASIDHDVPVTLLAEPSRGWFGRPGLEGTRADGRLLAPRFRLEAHHHDLEDPSSARFDLVDDEAGLGAVIDVVIDPSGIATMEVAVTNTGPDAVVLSAVRLCLPVPHQAVEVLTLGGRHALELVPTRTPWPGTVVTVENRRGKTSHERLGAVVAGTGGFSEQWGEVWAAHLGWSGNYEIVADAVTDGRQVLSVGELLLAGEVVLAPGERFEAAPVHLGHSDRGLTGLSQRFHRMVRNRPGHPTGPRPVHLNTWEAVYFDHDLDRLRQLVDRAAEVGIERFVLDDGWFHLRRHDRAGLGDWWVDPDVWPDGLAPLIDAVRAAGMEFGLWVEPEMVSPDSELYRRHPDWALSDARYPTVLARHQLVLDLGRRDVRQYLFERIDALLAGHDIAYLKWDHNRDLTPATSDGRAGVRAQTLGFYQLLDEIRTAHPRVEIETCASGGGRIDLGVLARTDRVWTSDSIDALDRQRIQRGFSVLVPPELMGAHIGAPTAHTTGRRHDLAFRGITALFGTLGVEWNLLDTTAADRAQLGSIIALHKRFRPLLHAGDVIRVDHPDPTVLVNGVVAADRSRALLAVVRMESGRSYHTPPVRVPGLDADRRYRVEWLPLGDGPIGPGRTRPRWMEQTVHATGRQLAAVGFHPPILHPETAICVHLHDDT